MSLADEARAVRQRIAARLHELEPLVREYEDLRRLAAEMGVDEDPSSPPRRGSASPPRSSAPGGQMAERVLAAVREDPGKTVAEYAKSLKMPATSLYRPVRELTSAGVLVKRARQLFPA
jgi:hypothetical protein